MKTDDIKLLYEYNFWADRRILATCVRVSREQYAARTSFGVGYGSLSATLVHILDSEWQWRLVCQTGSFGNELTEVDLPTLDALAARWQTEQQEMRAYLATLQDEDLNGIVRYPIPSNIVRERVLWHCLLHAVNHSTQHRSEAAALMTSYGQSPGDVDFTVFLNEFLHLPS